MPRCTSTAGSASTATYPLHRYFLMTKHIELTLGGATEQLLQLGAALAAEPV